VLTVRDDKLRAWGSDQSQRQADNARPRPVLERLRGLPLPLYALVDAARDRAIYPLLGTGAAESACLFEGEHAQSLPDYAAHLVQLAPDAPLLASLVRQGWGQSWGIYLASDRPFDELLAYLRQRCWVRGPTGARLYFRYYDPRVLRTALSAMGADELRAFLGPVASFIAESQSPDAMLTWTAHGQLVLSERLPVAL
jgi:hypothetical protein